ncbi:hypothetical protein I4U23_026832 [Adineta vaga]|nr:hypothetical protein I4U23_026832 [Adineta vaga]
MRDLQIKTGDCHIGLGKAQDWQKRSDPALSHYDRAMKIRQEVFGPKHGSVGEAYCYIGAVQWDLLKDYDEALINLKKAITILEESIPYYNKCLIVQQKILPPNHPQIAGSYNNIGHTYQAMSDYTKALEYYKKSLTINRQILPPTHQALIRTENNIRLLEEQMEN